MDEILRSEIIGKTLMNNGGYTIGIIDDIVLDSQTGEIKFFLVNFTSSIRMSQKTDSRGRGVITFSSMEVFGKNVIIS